MSIEPVTLSGGIVRLEPLQREHASDLYEASQDQRIWRFLPQNPSQSLAEIQNWIAFTLQLQEAGSILPFAIIMQEHNRAIGSTRYLDIQTQNRGLEIGWTWLTPTVQRTGVNTECKYLLLRHAFEQLGMIRVQLKTDSRNLQSQRAIERLGAVKEGTLRNHMILPDGYYRHSVYYSIIESEWPTVKAGLEEKMAGYK
jgi:RimJ/RimL family protein N-acetyltransferase